MKEFKKCKGINKAYGYDGCGNTVKANTRKAGLCPKCYQKWWITTTPEGERYISKLAKTAKKEVEKKQKEQEKEQDKKLKIKATNWKNKLQTEVQKIARYIDFGLPCLARGFTNCQLHGGHVYSKGGNSNIRFNLHNIHRQSAQSNKWQNDDGLLRERLAEEYGQQYWEMLQELRNKTPQPKYPNEVYHAFYLKARKIANKLEKENNQLLEPRSVRKRIELREVINQELGIYQPIEV